MNTTTRSDRPLSAATDAKLELLDVLAEKQYQELSMKIAANHRQLRTVIIACTLVVIASCCLSAGYATFIVRNPQYIGAENDSPQPSQMSIKTPDEKADALEEWQSVRAQKTKEYLQRIADTVRAAHAKKDLKHGEDTEVDISHRGRPSD